MQSNRHRCPSSWKKIEVYCAGEVKRSFNLGQFGQITDKLPVAKRRNLKKLEQAEQYTKPEPTTITQIQPQAAPSSTDIASPAQTSLSNFPLFYDDFPNSLDLDFYDFQSLLFD